MIDFFLSYLDTITVQAPHPPSAHPSLVPVSFTDHMLSLF